VVATRLCALGAVAGIKPRPRAGNDFVRLGLESPSLAAALLPRLDVFLCSPARALPLPDHTPPPPGCRSSCYSPAALPVCHPLSAIPYSAYPPSPVAIPCCSLLRLSTIPCCFSSIPDCSSLDVSLRAVPPSLPTSKVSSSAPPSFVLSPSAPPLGSNCLGACCLLNL
jgi:hypothetical protein